MKSKRSLNEIKVGDIFWIRRVRNIGGPENFMRIVEIAAEGHKRKEDNELMFKIKTLRTWVTNPHRIKRVLTDYDLTTFYTKMTEEEAKLARMFFNELIPEKMGS